MSNYTYDWIIKLTDVFVFLHLFLNLVRHVGDYRSTDWPVPVTDQALKPIYGVKNKQIMHSQSHTH